MKRLMTACLLAILGMMGAQAQSIYDMKVKDEAGKDVTLAEYKDKVLLIVNTATRCGFTPQYKELESLYEKYRSEGLEILDFPCNQFGEQAPGTIQEIHQFCTANFDIQFPQFDKIEVNGANEHPLYSYLKAQRGFSGFDTNDQRGKMMDGMLRKKDADYDKKADIKWNFTKFLVSRDGRVVKRYEPTEPMANVEADVCIEVNPVLSTIMARRSVRKYLDKPVEHEKLEVIARAGINAPSGMNRQPWIESMIYWANVSVHCGDDYQILFPPSMHLGFDHHKNYWTSFPIGPRKEEVELLPSQRSKYADDISGMMDLSWWRNFTIESRSIFGMDPDNAFMAGYDHGKGGGTVHVSDRHVAVGKKFFLWGNFPEAHVWDKVLTDADGPYLELMVGCWSDNQPDYSWIAPYETRTVKQYWFPVKGIGGVKTAIAVNIETYPTHIAGLPCVVNMSCHATRHASELL